MISFLLLLATRLDAGTSCSRLAVPGSAGHARLPRAAPTVRVTIRPPRDNQQQTREAPKSRSGGFCSSSWAVQRTPRCGWRARRSRCSLLKVRAIPAGDGARSGRRPRCGAARLGETRKAPGSENAGADEKGASVLSASGGKELACGSQAFIATLLFDPSMSALPIIVKQNSPSVGLFTH